MEIKKGISQMAEYPNKEINYVVPADGKMYYVLDDGVLENGTVIATLNAKHVVDPSVVCNDMGAFMEDGSVLIDFNNEELKKINEDLLLAVKAIPETNEVLDTVSKESDAINKALIEDNMAIIESKVLDEMGTNGEILFSNAFKEACVYKTDSYNNKVGIDCSLIGKNETNLYFHTNVVNSETVVVSLSGASLSELPVVDEDNSVEENTEIKEEDVSDIGEDIGDAPLDLKLDINDSILSGFNKPVEEEETEEKVAPEEEESTTITSDDIEKEMASVSDDEVEDESDDSEDSSDEDDEEVTTDTEVSDDKSDNDKVLDDTIATMKKLIEETTRLKERINELEEELALKNKVLDEEDAKKDTLSDLLDEANDALKDSE